MKNLAKVIASAVFCLTLALPMMVSAQDCCCECAPVPKRVKKSLRLVDVQKEVCRIKKVCVTDECGCSKTKFVKVKECVTRKKLMLVDDPCKKCIGERVCDRLRSAASRLRAKLKSCGCNDGCAPACPPVDPCGCN